MAETSTFQIPKDVIEPIIQAHIAAAVTAALSGEGQLMTKAVAMVLNQKVDSDGKPSSGYYNSEVTYIQWVMRDVLRKATRAAIEQEIAKHEVVLREHIATQLRSSKSPLVRQLVSGMVGAMVAPDALKYRLTITAAEK